MSLIWMDQLAAYRQVEYGLRCPVCGAPMEAVQRSDSWFLECQECVTVFGGFSGSKAGGFPSRQEAVDAFLLACKYNHKTPN